MTHPLQEIYNGFADTYEANRGLFDISEILNKFYYLLEREQGSLLDLGCGAGEPVAQYFIDNSWSVTGIDFSERMLELASRYVPEMTTIRTNIVDAKFSSNQFDAITATYSLFHIPTSHHTALFKKIYQWLRPDGHFLFTYATEEYTGSKEFDGYKHFMNRQLYYSHKGPTTLYADLENIGFN
ncbi:MAG: class I SAM-dependent methyltransferase, partial [Gammaproteobacteria bacterium]|nr:class I SAM-dependent methyltransferase [Gammaproteobacteria bacterium]